MPEPPPLYAKEQRLMSDSCILATEYCTIHFVLEISIANLFIFTHGWLLGPVKADLLSLGNRITFVSFQICGHTPCSKHLFNMWHSRGDIYLSFDDSTLPFRAPDKPAVLGCVQSLPTPVDTTQDWQKAPTTFLLSIVNMVLKRYQLNISPGVCPRSVWQDPPGDWRS